jgi:hypothetical protein
MNRDSHVHSVLQLYPKNGDYESVVEFMRRERVPELSQENGGLLASSINVPMSREGPIVVLAKWNSASDYQRWVSNPVREGLRPELSALLEREAAAGQLFSIHNGLREYARPPLKSQVLGRS